MKYQIIIALATFALAVGGAWVGAGIGVSNMASVQAAPPAVPDCVAIGKSGPLVVSRCEDDETGAVIFVNNYGMMVVEP